MNIIKKSFKKNTRHFKNNREYYQAISEITHDNFQGADLVFQWFSVFYATLNRFHPEYTFNVAFELFCYFGMGNWTALHKDKTEYKDDTPQEMLEHFYGELNYCSDRMSYDRLFRTHWLFLQTDVGRDITSWAMSAK